MTAAETFFEFLETTGSIGSDDCRAFIGNIEEMLKQAFTEQHDYQAEQDETERFLQLLRAAFSSGNAHLANRLNQGPPPSRPFAWGWRDAGKDLTGDKQYKPMGDCIGWYAEASGNAPAEAWLEPNTAFKIVQEFARHQGDSFLVSSGSLWRRMQERGLLLKLEPDGKTGKPKTCVKRVVAGRSIRVLVVSADLVESGE